MKVRRVTFPPPSLITYLVLYNKVPTTSGLKQQLKAPRHTLAGCPQLRSLQRLQRGCCLGPLSHLQAHLEGSASKFIHVVTNKTHFTVNCLTEKTSAPSRLLAGGLPGSFATWASL